ncbi:MAG: cation:proton antiporter [Thermoplasmata archaeon]
MKKRMMTIFILLLVFLFLFSVSNVSNKVSAEFSNEGIIAGWSGAINVTQAEDNGKNVLELTNGSVLYVNNTFENPSQTEISVKLRFPDGKASCGLYLILKCKEDDFSIKISVNETMMNVTIMHNSPRNCEFKENKIVLNPLPQSEYFHVKINFLDDKFQIKIYSTKEKLCSLSLNTDEHSSEITQVVLATFITNESRTDGRIWLDNFSITKRVEEKENITHLVTRIAFLLGVVILSAKIFGELFEKRLKIPGVLGELVAGMLIGPYALGGLAFTIGGITLGPIFDGPIFNPLGSTSETSIILYTFAQIGAVILLFVAGLETNPEKFFSAGKSGMFIALGGVLVPFALGYIATVIYNGDSIAGLFIGAILTATSVGITARVLSDVKKLNTPEGIMILCAAVIDDVIGIIVLVIVVGIVTTGTVSVEQIALVSIKAVVFWGGMLLIGVKFSHILRKMLGKFTTAGASFAFAFVLCLFAAFLAETVGLAMIIGAYALGLAFAKLEDIAEKLREQIYSLYHTLVPIFFVVMGMLVDFRAMLPVIGFGLVISLLAIIGKILGCGAVSMLGEFNKLGALRIGMGMVPRGEVALIVASYALVLGAIGSDLYGVAIIMTAITTFITPVILVTLFSSNKEGLKSK